MNLNGKYAHLIPFLHFNSMSTCWNPKKNEPCQNLTSQNSGDFRNLPQDSPCFASSLVGSSDGVPQWMRRRPCKRSTQPFSKTSTASMAPIGFAESDDFFHQPLWMGVLPTFCWLQHLVETPFILLWHAILFMSEIVMVFLYPVVAFEPQLSWLRGAAGA